MSVLAIAAASGAAEAQASRASEVSRTPYTVAPTMLPTQVKPGGPGGPVEPRDATLHGTQAASDKEKRLEAKPDGGKPAEPKTR